MQVSACPCISPKLTRKKPCLFITTSIPLLPMWDSLKTLAAGASKRAGSAAPAAEGRSLPAGQTQHEALGRGIERQLQAWAKCRNGCFGYHSLYHKSRADFVLKAKRSQVARKREKRSNFWDSQYFAYSAHPCMEKGEKWDGQMNCCNVVDSGTHFTIISAVKRRISGGLEGKDPVWHNDRIKAITS